MLRVKTLHFKISNAKWKDEGGGVSKDLLEKAEEKLNLFLIDLDRAAYTDIDIKINHYTVQRHNNGGCDEVWVQYTILYKDK